VLFNYTSPILFDMKKIIVIISSIILSFASQAQVKPYVINSLGRSSQCTSGNVAYSVGEPFIGSLAGSSYKLNQGLLQSFGSYIKGFAIKLYLEGLYADSGRMLQAQDIAGPKFEEGISDKVTVEFHKAYPPFDLVYSFQDVSLNMNGNVSVNNFPDSLTGSYYMVIKSRNNLETWSSTPVDINIALHNSYDFSLAASQAYGNNLKPMGGNVYALYGGDANQDGLVDGGDMAAIDNANVNVLVGYYPEDVNGDGLVDGSDMAIIDNNSAAVVFAKRP